MKVYNTGSTPIVYQDNRFGKKVIHPRKFVDEPEEAAKRIIAQYNDASATPAKLVSKPAVGKEKEK